AAKLAAEERARGILHRRPAAGRADHVGGGAQLPGAQLPSRRRPARRPGAVLSQQCRSAGRGGAGQGGARRIPGPRRPRSPERLLRSQGVGAGPALVHDRRGVHGEVPGRGAARRAAADPRAGKNAGDQQEPAFRSAGDGRGVRDRGEAGTGGECV
ncbi:MAG: Protein of unknown function DUF55, partial [uncultured Gemmatimonadetes bacterium]